MAHAQHKLSRRAVLAGACAVPATGAAACLSGDPGLCRDDGTWRKALALYARAEAELEAVAHTQDDDLYDRALGRHNAALARLLRSAAPDLAAVADKLDLVLRHQLFELSFAGPCLAALQADVRRLADSRS